MTLLNFQIRLLFLFSILFYSTSCETDEDVQDNVNKFEQYIVGLWTIKSGASYAINEKGETIITATLKKNTFAHEILAGGKYIGHDYVGNKKEEGNWKLEDITETNDEFKATLAISTPGTQALSGEISVDTDGFQRFKLSINIKSTPETMSLISKEYVVYPYEKNWVEFLFSKP